MSAIRNRAWNAYAQHAYALGQLDPYQGTIRDIARSFPACFTASDMVPVIEHSQNFVRQISTMGLSRWGGLSSPDLVKKQLDRVWNDLETWKRRFAAEGGKRYCNNDNSTKADHWKFMQAIMQPYIEASGVEAARAVVTQAAAQLKEDLLRLRVTLGPVDNPWFDQPMLPKWLDLSRALPLALGLATALVVYKLVSGRKETVKVIEKQPEPEKKKAA
jgi:hypothetical protein